MRVLPFVIALALAVPPPTQTIPAFARRYKVRCRLCHDPVPKLTPFGEQFAANGFRSACFSRSTSALRKFRAGHLLTLYHGIVCMLPSREDRTSLGPPDVDLATWEITCADQHPPNPL
jgi:hypothetical protein